ncbi:MAG: phosphoglucosamine mutase [Magnetococcales bacterium]|nr:phosphoglucosamine mutase [Magnetococcales bacterium]
MTRKLFGTDGIRGPANQYPLTADMVLRLGRAAGIALRRGEHLHRVVIGMDTRRSGDMFESALRAGFASAGMRCLLASVMPTPGVAFLTRSLRADMGVMISASHNPHYDNGLKFFGPDGMKLADETEIEIERILFANEPTNGDTLPPEELGGGTRITGAIERYIEFCKNVFPSQLTLDGIRLVVDTANGAAYEAAPTILKELGADVICINNKPDGININENAGSLHPEIMANAVRQHNAHAGLAFDGDADRLIICDENGSVQDGDSIMAICALEMKKQNVLKGGGVVSTVMSNLGLERLLEHNELSLIRTKVGDRYVLQHMREHDFNFGGEQSGHLIFLDHNTTGDGLVSALQVLSVIVGTGKSLSQLCAPLKRVPQVLKNIMVSADADALAINAVQDSMAKAEKELGNQGRILVRKSGTEPKIRVMVEGDSLDQINALADQVLETIRIHAC